MPPQANKGGARFLELDGLRQDYLMQIRECSALTKPKVFPPEGYIPNSPVAVSWQSHGERMVSNMISQLLLILFPPNIPFFHLDISDLDLKQMASSMPMDGEGGAKSQYDYFKETFLVLENNSAVKFESLGYREQLRKVMAQLVVGGSSCFVNLPSGGIKVYPIDDWVCRRDNEGSLIEVVTRDVIARETSKAPDFLGVPDDKTEATIYTHSKREGDIWVTTTYNHEGSMIRSATFTLKNFIYSCPTWELYAKDDYGTGLVLENIADIRTLETGTQLLTESTQSMAKLLFMVSPNGMTKARDLSEAPNGGCISGEAEDVGVLSANKTYDFQGFSQLLQSIRQDLDASFMMASVIRRDAERVTAEEIRRMSTEFEKAKGGIYSGLSTGIQSPIARSLLSVVLKSTSLIGDGLKLDQLVPVISAGLHGLGRSLELENFLAFMGDIKALGADTLINMEAMVTRLAALRNIVTKGLVKSTGQVQQEAQDAQAQNLVDKVAPQVVKNMGPMGNQSPQQPNI